MAVDNSLKPWKVIISKAGTLIGEIENIHGAAKLSKIPGWWRAAANDDYYQTAYRLTEFGLGD